MIVDEDQISHIGELDQDQDVQEEDKADKEVHPHYNPKGMPALITAFTLVGNRLGGGVVGVPYAIMTIGYVTGVIYMWFHAWFWLFAVYLFLKVKDIIGRASLSDIGLYWYGKYSIYVFNSLIALPSLGYPIIFFIVFGDVSGELIKRAHGGSSFWSSRWFTHSILGVLMIYLIIKKDISNLKYAGIFLFGWIWWFLVIFLIHFLISDPSPQKEVDLTETKVNLAFFAAFPTIVSGFNFKPAFFPSFSTLRMRINSNGFFIWIFALTSLLCCNFFTPLIACLMYGKNLKPNLLLNISAETGVLPTILQFLFLCIAIVHIPLIFFVGKEAVLIMFDEATRKSYSNPKPTPPKDATVGVPENVLESVNEVPVIEEEILHDPPADGEVVPSRESNPDVLSTSQVNVLMKNAPSPISADESPSSGSASESPSHVSGQNSSSSDSLEAPDPFSEDNKNASELEGGGQFSSTPSNSNKFENKNLDDEKEDSKKGDDIK